MALVNGLCTGLWIKLSGCRPFLPLHVFLISNIRFNGNKDMIMMMMMALFCALARDTSSCSRGGELARAYTSFRNLKPLEVFLPHP